MPTAASNMIRNTKVAAPAKTSPLSMSKGWHDTNAGQNELNCILGTLVTKLFQPLA